MTIACPNPPHLGTSETIGGDPLQCPCCKGTMKPVRKVIRRDEIEFFLCLHGLWEGIVTLPRPPPPPFDIETMEPIEPPWQAPEIHLDDGRILVLEYT